MLAGSVTVRDAASIKLTLHLANGKFFVQSIRSSEEKQLPSLGAQKLVAEPDEPSFPEGLSGG